MFMYLYVHKCVYIHVFLCVYIYEHAVMPSSLCEEVCQLVNEQRYLSKNHVYISIYVYIHVCEYVYVYPCVYTYMYIHIYVCMCIYTYMCSYRCIYIYHIYTYIKPSRALTKKRCTSQNILYSCVYTYEYIDMIIYLYITLAPSNAGCDDLLQNNEKKITSSCELSCGKHRSNLKFSGFPL